MQYKVVLTFNYSGDERTITLHEIDGGLGHSICIPSAVVHQKKNLLLTQEVFFLPIPAESKRPAEQREATNSPVDCLLGRGRFHLCLDVVGTTIDRRKSFPAASP